MAYDPSTAAFTDPLQAAYTNNQKQVPRPQAPGVSPTAPYDPWSDPNAAAALNAQGIYPSTPPPPAATPPFTGTGQPPDTNTGVPPQRTGIGPGTLPAVQAPASTPFNASTYYGKTDVASITAYVNGMLAGTGRESTAPMWVNYIVSKGGGPNGYWDNLIKTNQGGDAGVSTGGPTGAPGQTILGVNPSSYVGGGLSPQDQSLRDALVKQLTTQANQSLNINPLTDSTIQMETAPYTAEQTRVARNLEAQNAEAAGPNANVSAQNAVIQEAAGQAAGAYSAGLVQNELTARRTQIQQALTSMQGILTAEESNQLQQELASLNAAVSLSESQVAAQNQLQQAIYNNNYNLFNENRVSQGLPPA